MARFQKKQEYGSATSTELPLPPPSVTNQKPQEKSSPSPCSIPTTGSVREYIFHFDVTEGEIRHTEYLSEDQLDLYLQRIAQTGARFPSTYGFVWYPPHSIRKVNIIQ
jgi:hypothetical protein